ncbi:transcription factor A, mitochondrial-like [Clavelina lepadiformis]|uniref:HMG box domain-containing protein n=1 Tax=Clavelina lepadiformis TaxID=159417 RepID=A0ABP0F0I4_CLALP
MELILQRFAGVALNRSTLARACLFHQTSKLQETLQKPVRPPSSFGLFLLDKHKEFAENGKLFMKKAANEWKVLPEFERNKYVEKANEIMDNYKEAVKDLSDFQRDQIKLERKEKRVARAKRKDKKIKVSMGVPKRPLNPYAWFIKTRILQDATTIYPKQKITSKWAMLAVEWRNMDEEDRKEYQILADEDKDRYLQEMKGYVKKLRDSDMEYLIPNKYFNKWTDDDYEEPWDDVMNKWTKK